MKRLNLNPAPRWVEIDAELSVAVRPLSPFDLAEMFEGEAELAGMAATLQDGEATAAGAGADANGGGMGALRVGKLLDLVGRFAELALDDWTVSDETGERLPVTAEAVRALLRAEPELAVPFIDRIIAPAVSGAEALQSEKNGSAPSPAGSTAGAEITAPDATASARPARQD